MSAVPTATTASSAPVAIIDVGSNTIKCLVARKAPDGGLTTLLSRTCDARISRGISAAAPVLSEEGMQVGLEAIQSLLNSAQLHSPSSITLVATSAVRSASNGSLFCERILAATGHTLRILSGDEEARLIGRGLACDPALAASGNFYVFDLGGGSLECLAYSNGTLQNALSLPLGCVRLTERFVADPTEAIEPAILAALARHTTETLEASSFKFELTNPSAVFAGGSMTTARAIIGAAVGLSLKESPPVLSLVQLEQLLQRLAALPLERRKVAIAGLPPARADVFPAALTTMIAAGKLARVDAFRHSFYNLRYGLAAELLASATA